MRIQRNADLADLNTLAVPSKAEYFCLAESIEEVNEALEWAGYEQCRVQILAGGSNVVLADRVGGLVIKPQILGAKLVEQSSSEVRIRFGAGENWHQTVVWCLQRGYIGLENLALIPGTVGAAPVQNIGAYGVEVGRLIESVEYVDRATGQLISLDREQCEFAYRDSIFKHELKNKAVITHVTLKLSNDLTYYDQLDRTTLYPALLHQLKSEGDIDANKVFDAVCAIRQAKLPDPAKIPNCGSFFKNPVVPYDQYEGLHAAYPSMPSYPAPLSAEGVAQRKLAAAWLIDQAGWRGAVKYGVGTHEQQALVLVNPNRCASEHILNLAKDICEAVEGQFNVVLEMEPQQLL